MGGALRRFLVGKRSNLAMRSATVIMVIPFWGFRIFRARRLECRRRCGFLRGGFVRDQSW
jgi:hypothetical protein